MAEELLGSRYVVNTISSGWASGVRVARIAWFLSHGDGISVEELFLTLTRYQPRLPWVAWLFAVSLASPLLNKRTIRIAPRRAIQSLATC